MNVSFERSVLCGRRCLPEVVRCRRHLGFHLSDWMQVAAEKSLMAVWRFYIVNLFHEINEVMGNLES